MPKKKHPLELNEKTRVSLQFNNLWAIIASAIMVAFSSAMVYYQHMSLNEKMAEMVIAQREYNKEFSEWKNRVETRLGNYALKINTLETIVGVKN